MKRIGHILRDVWAFYVTGFREMTWGRTLWILILVKLFLIFVFLSRNFQCDFRPFFQPCAECLASFFISEFLNCQNITDYLFKIIIHNR